MTPANRYEAMLIQHGRFQMLAELTELEFPMTRTRLVNELSKTRGWGSLSYEQKEQAVRNCNGNTDSDTLRKAIKAARKI